MRLVFSGATDGSVAVWDLTGSEAGRRLEPVLALSAVHQSGVNALSVACSGAGRLLLLTGGDDQALRLTLLRVEREGGGLSIGVLADAHLPNAHSSSVKVS